MMVVKNGFKEYREASSPRKQMGSNAEAVLKELRAVLDSAAVGNPDASVITRVRGLIKQKDFVSRDRLRLVQRKSLYWQEIRCLNALIASIPRSGKLDASQVFEIVIRHDEGETYRQIAQDYPVSESVIGRIVRAYNQRKDEEYATRTSLADRKTSD